MIRRNAYLVETVEGDTIGVYNTRQLRPHRQALLKNATEIEDHQNIDQPEISREVLMITIVSIDRLKEAIKQEKDTSPEKIQRYTTTKH